MNARGISKQLDLPTVVESQLIQNVYNPKGSSPSLNPVRTRNEAVSKSYALPQNNTKNY
jgi:hypothetical protein